MLIVAFVVVALGAIGALAGGGDDDDADDAAATTASATVTSPAPTSGASTSVPTTAATSAPAVVSTGTDPAASVPPSTDVIAQVNVEVGDCVETMPQGADLFAVVEAIGCDEVHIAETHAQEDLPLDGAYPGTEALDAAARPICLQRFAEYVGQPMDRTPFVITWFVPTEPGWERDDREVTCLVQLPVAGTGSVRQIDVSSGWNGYQSITALQPGQCFDEPTDLPGLVSLLDCAAPHAFEVVGTTRLADGPFPADSVQGSAEMFCLQAFAEYVGTSFDASPLDMIPERPSAESWELGDRTIACLVAANGSTGSVAGTGAAGG